MRFFVLVLCVVGTYAFGDIRPHRDLSNTNNNYSWITDLVEETYVNGMRYFPLYENVKESIDVSCYLDSNLPNRLLAEAAYNFGIVAKQELNALEYALILDTLKHNPESLAEFYTSKLVHIDMFEVRSRVYDNICKNCQSKEYCKIVERALRDYSIHFRSEFPGWKRYC